MPYRAWPYGFSWLHHYFDTNSATSLGRDFSPQAYLSPLVDGISSWIPWWFFYADPTVQSAEDWTILDAHFAGARANGKWVRLIVPGWGWFPTWAINQLVLNTDYAFAFCDEGILQNSKQGPMTGMLTSTRSPGVCIPIVAPWSTAAQTIFDAFLTRLAARYAGNPALRSVSLPLGAYSCEMHLPDGDVNGGDLLDSINQLIAIGYTGGAAGTYTTACAHYATLLQGLFPRQVLAVTFHTPPPINSSGVYAPGSGPSSEAQTNRANVAAACDAVLGDQAIFGDAGERANSGPLGGWGLAANSYSGRRLTFMQETTSSAKKPDTQDPNQAGAPPYVAATAVADVWKNAQSCGSGIMLFEWFEPTPSFDYLPLVLQSKSGGASARNVTVTLGNALTSGSGLIAVVVNDGSADPTFTGLTGWTKIASQAFNAASTNRVTIWTRPQQAGDGQATTADGGGTATQIDLAVFELSLVVSGGAITADASASAQDAGGTTNTLTIGPTGTLAQAREWAILAVGLSGTSGGSATFDGLWTVQETTTRLLTAFQAVVATTPLSGTTTWTNNRRCGGAVATLVPAPSGPVTAALVAARAGYFGRLNSGRGTHARGANVGPRGAAGPRKLA